MKKTILYLLCICMMLCMCACGGPSPEAETEATTAPVETTKNPAKAILDGKKILFIGNSHTYVGNVVKQVYNKYPEQEKRSNNQGFFWLFSMRQGCDVAVTNWTFSSHGLSSIFRKPCEVKGDCYGLNHADYLTDRYFDYVVIQPGVGKSSEELVAEDIAYIVDFFKKENPDVKFALLGNASVYGNNKDGTTYPGISSYYKTLAEEGFIMADWGKLVNDLIKGTVAPEGSAIPYAKSSFVIKDGFHPNYLSGYIASVMLYCAITGQPAAELPADMFQDSAMAIMVEDHLKNCYVDGAVDTNFHMVLTTQSELQGIHKLIDQYLAEKPYLQ